jgi:nicotinic acid mononucleotide adenylyltransferase
VGNHTHSFTQPIYAPPVTTLTSATDSATWTRMIDEMMRYPQKYQAKEKTKTMTTLEKVRAEREEARERQRIERLYAAWDEQELDEFENGTVMRFEWTPKDVTYSYAVLKAADKWWATGHSANGLPTEDIIAWLIGKDVDPADVEYLS